MQNQSHITLKVEYDIEADGRVIADIAETPGAIALGRTQEEAMQKAFAIALEIIADEIRHGERPIKNIAINSDIRQVSGKFKITSPYDFDEIMDKVGSKSLMENEDIHDWVNMKPVGRELL